MLVLFVGVVALGINSLLNMPRSEDPDFTMPSFVVIYVYPGTDAVDMEALIVDKVEERFSELSNVKTLRTTVDDGLALVTIEYDYDQDVNEKYQEVVREVNALAKDLPADIFRTEIRKFSPSDVNIVQIALQSETATYEELGNQAERLKKALSKVKGLKNVSTWGFPERIVQVDLHLDKLVLFGLSPMRVLGALQAENEIIPGGTIHAGSRRFNVTTNGTYESLEEIGRTVVGSNGQRIVYLKDVATLSLGYQEESHLVRLNGYRSVLVTAAQKEGEHIQKVGRKINEVVEAFSSSLPANIQLVQHFDQAESVGKRLGRFVTDFAIAIFLVSLTLLPLGFRAALVVMISIPLSLSIGLASIDYLGFNINQLSIVGLIVSLGILVDDSIVVVENIERWIREGYPKREAAVKATKQITLAVIGCTATLILAFLPLNFMPEASGDFIRSLPMAVTMTILASMIVSLTIVPFLSSRILKTEHHPEGNIFMRSLKKVISRSYSRVLHWALQHPIPTLVSAGILFGLSLLIPGIIGFSLFPKSEKPMFMITMETPEGSSLQETDRIAREIEARLRNIPEIKYVTTNVGKGNPRIYYNVIQKAEATNYGEFFVQLHPISPHDKSQLIDQLRADLSDIPNARVLVKDFEQGPNTEAPIVLRIFGENLDTLQKVAADVEKILQRTPGTLYIDNPLMYKKTGLKVEINKEKAGMLGVSIADINRSVRLAIAGLDMGTFKTGTGDEFPIKISIPKGKYADQEVFNSIYVPSLMGAPVPLNQIAELKLESQANQIRHYDQERYVTVSAYIQSGFLVDDVYKEVLDQMNAYPMPEDFKYRAAGEIEAREQSFGGLDTVILITLFGFFGVLILEFRSFKSTLIVLSVIPLGVIGAFTTLWLVGFPLSFVAVIGLIALVGIEVKNSILLVDFTDQLRREGVPLVEAIERAGEIRFVPIVLTTLTAIGGLIPLAIEGNPLYSPLAWVLIGGLISSTLLSRIVTPVLYKLLPPTV